MTYHTLFELSAIMVITGGRMFVYFFTRYLAGLLALLGLLITNLFPEFVSCRNFQI